MKMICITEFTALNARGRQYLGELTALSEAQLFSFSFLSIKKSRSHSMLTVLYSISILFSAFIPGSI